MAKGINRIKRLKGSVYKHRYHFRQISSPRQLKNVMNYIFTNGLKHKTASKILNPYNSIKAEMKHELFTKEKIQFDEDLLKILNRATVFYKAIDYA